VKVTVDRELCMGAGLCVLYAPGTFAHDAETKAVVLEPITDDIETVRNAVTACPTSAITIVPGSTDEGA
jgi:ferredoxin